MTEPTPAAPERPGGSEKTTIPWVAITLAVLNVGVFAWQISAGADVASPTPQWISDHGGNYGPLTLDGQQWRLFTSMFLHVGILHLAMNMIGLLDGGRHVEKMYGRAGFIALYVVAGLAGSLASALRNTNVVSAGASGAIFGIFGAFGAFLLLHRSRLDAVEVGKQARGLMIFLAYNLYIGLAVQGIDLLAHLGGLVAGFICGLALEYGTSEKSSSVKRSLLVGVLGVALVIGGSMLAKPPESPNAAFNEAVAGENRVMARWRELGQQVGEGKLTEPAFADAVEKELLPPWRTTIANYERDGKGELKVKMLAYLRAREEGWQLLVKAIRTNDEAIGKQGFEKLKDADTMIQVINSTTR